MYQTHNTVSESKNGGFLKVIILIVIAIGALWYFKIDLRSIVGLEPETRYQYTWRAKIDSVWYGYLVWYDKQTKSSKPIGWVQNKVNNLFESNSATSSVETIEVEEDIQ